MVLKSFFESVLQVTFFFFYILDAISLQGSFIILVPDMENIQ